MAGKDGAGLVDQDRVRPNLLDAPHQAGDLRLGVLPRVAREGLQRVDAKPGDLILQPTRCGRASDRTGCRQSDYPGRLPCRNMPTSGAGIVTLLHARIPNRRERDRFATLRDRLLVFPPSDRSDGQEYRTRRTDRYRQFLIPTVADRNPTSQTPARSRLVRRKSLTGLKGATCSPVAGAEASSSSAIRNAYMRSPSNAQALPVPRCAGGTAPDRFRFVHGGLDRFSSGGLGSGAPHPILVERHGRQPPIARPLGPRNRW